MATKELTPQINAAQVTNTTTEYHRDPDGTTHEVQVQRCRPHNTMDECVETLRMWYCSQMMVLCSNPDHPALQINWDGLKDCVAPP